MTPTKSLFWTVYVVAVTVLSSTSDVNALSVAICTVYWLTPRELQLSVGFAVVTCWLSVGEVNGREVLRQKIGSK